MKPVWFNLSSMGVSWWLDEPWFKATGFKGTPPKPKLFTSYHDTRSTSGLLQILVGHTLLAIKRYKKWLMGHIMVQVTPAIDMQFSTQSCTCICPSWVAMTLYNIQCMEWHANPPSWKNQTMLDFHCRSSQDLKEWVPVMADDDVLGTRSWQTPWRF